MENAPFEYIVTAYINNVECYVAGCKFGRAILRPKNPNDITSYSIPESDLPLYQVYVINTQ